MTFVIRIHYPKKFESPFWLNRTIQALNLLRPMRGAKKNEAEWSRRFGASNSTSWPARSKVAAASAGMRWQPWTWRVGIRLSEISRSSGNQFERFTFRRSVSYGIVLAHTEMLPTCASLLTGGTCAHPNDKPPEADLRSNHK
jgi:hypothetical protein